MINQRVSRPQLRILNSVKHINLFLAGVGSGKTHLAGIKSYQLIKKFPSVRGFLGANTYLQLTQSSLFRIREYWKSIGVTEYDKQINQSGMYVVNKKPPAHFNTENHNFDDYYGIISFQNGWVGFTGSMDRAEVHSGKEVGWAMLDEVKDTDETDIKEHILTRLRQKGMYIKDGKLDTEGEPFNPIYFFTSPAKEQWLNEWFNLESYIEEIAANIYSDKTFFFKEFSDKCVTISSTYHNQKNLPTSYVKEILDNNTEERGRALIFGNPFSSTGGEFYSSFNRLKHVVNVKYDPSIPLHLSFDQNTVPYNSCGISQVKKEGNNWVLTFIDEIALENPRNSTEEVCEEFMMRYPNHKAGLFYYGDASGKNRSTMSKDFKHHYEIIAFKLRKYLNNGSDRTLFSNPPLVKRRDFMNLILEEKLPLRIYFNESCKKMIADMMYTKQALDGGKDKHIVTDKDTGEKYQKYGHFGDLCFVGETKVITSEGEKRIDSVKVGDYVLTRKGYKKVTANVCNGFRKVGVYKIGDKKITCTGDHRIYADGNFYMVSSLIKKNIIAIFVEKKTWIEKLLFTAVINSIDTLNQLSPQIEIISKDGSKIPVNGEKQASIFSNTQQRSGLFQKAIQYIILTAILTITKFQIMPLCLVENILHCIMKIVHRNTRTQTPKNSLGLLSLHQKLGTDQKRAESGIENTLRRFFLAKKRKESVLNAIKNLRQILIGFRNTAISNVKTKQLVASSETTKDTLKTGFAKDAEKCIQLADGGRINFAVVNVRKVNEYNDFVFDITVEDEHEFFANGILVHNCEYQVVELFKNYYNG